MRDIENKFLMQLKFSNERTFKRNFQRRKFTQVQKMCNVNNFFNYS